MKLSICAIALFLLLSLASCEFLLEEFSSDTETDAHIVETEKDTYMPPEGTIAVPDTEKSVEGTSPAPIEVSTEPMTEATTEPMTETTTEPAEETTEPAEETTEPLPDETLEPLVFEDEELNLLLDELRADGYDMEQLTFRGASENGKEYRYTVTFENRAFQTGETIVITVADILCGGDAYSAEEGVREGLLEICMSRLGENAYSNVNEFVYLDGGRMAFTIPDDFEKGAYSLMLFIGEGGEKVEPIIIY